jgi:hypothetical protein
MVNCRRIACPAARDRPLDAEKALHKPAADRRQ